MGISPSFLQLGAFLLIHGVYGDEGQELGALLVRHKQAVETYIMAGHGRGWDACDIITQHASFKAGPQWVLELQRLRTFETSVLSHASCILVAYIVKTEQSLETLMEFGRSVILKKRLAFLLKLDSNITLDSVNRTNSPFLVLAEMSGRREKFLCPVVGMQEVRVQDDMCEQSYTSYKNKVLQVGILGRPPFFKVTKGKDMDGVDVQLIKLLAEKKGFVANITIPKNLWASITMVCTKGCSQI